MKRFILPFFIALGIHAVLIWGNFDFFKKKPDTPPEIQFMTMTLSHFEATEPIKKPPKKNFKKKKIEKKIHKKKQPSEPKIEKIPEEKKEAAEYTKETTEETEEPKTDVSRIQKASPLYNYNPAPNYPRNARKRGWQGIVMLLVLVDKHGKVRSVKIHKSSGYSLLDNSALSSVKNWKFSPGLKDDEPVETEVEIPVKFSLTG